MARIPRRTHRFPLSRLSAFSTGMLIVLLLLAGCGAHAGASAATLRIWYSTDDPVERAWSQHLVQQFRRGHPGIQVSFDVLSFEDLNTKLQLALSGGNPPDLAYVTPRGPGIPAYVGAHRLLDLTAASQSHQWAAKLRPHLLSDYNRPFAHYGLRSGTVVAVPTALAVVGVLCNQHLLARLHLAVPNTLTSFRAALQRALAAGYVPLGMGNADGWLGDDWYLTLVNSLVEPSALQPEQTLSPAFSFQRPPYRQAGSILLNWANHGYFTPDFGGLDAQEGVDQFFHGKTLFQLISSSENAQIQHDQQQTHLPIGVFAFPHVRGGGVAPYSGYLGWVVPAAARHHQLAIDFINSLLTPPTAQFLLQQGVLPAHAAVIQSAQVPVWQRQYLQALDSALPGVYLDAAPISNLNATMEANVQLLLQGYEDPNFLVKSLQEVYASHGTRGNTSRIDGEF